MEVDEEKNIDKPNKYKKKHEQIIYSTSNLNFPVIHSSTIKNVYFIINSITNLSNFTILIMENMLLIRMSNSGQSLNAAKITAILKIRTKN